MGNCEENRHEVEREISWAITTMIKNCIIDLQLQGSVFKSVFKKI
jgi:hypothetical protein